MFPSMGITLTVDVGEDEHVVLVPRHENEFLEVGTVASVDEQIRLPGGGRAVTISGAAPRADRRRPDRPRGRAARRGRGAPRRRPRRWAHAQPRTRIPRHRRGDPRAARRRRAHRGVPARDRRARAAGRLRRLLPQPDLRAEGAAAAHARRHRPPGARRQAAARVTRRAAGAQAHPRGRPGRRGEAAARLLPAQADGVDPQGARRGRGLDRRGVPHEDRGRRDA